MRACLRHIDGEDVSGAGGANSMRNAVYSLLQRLEAVVLWFGVALLLPIRHRLFR